MKFKLILTTIILLLCLFFSIFLSRYTYNSDFAVFYHASSTILDPGRPNTSVYEIGDASTYSIPEAIGKNHIFVYSMAVAYIMTPLALMPYYTAKSAMIFINILLYLAAISIVLKLGNASGRWFSYSLALLCLWSPWIQDLRQGQVNAILLFLIAVAVLAAVKNRSNLCGILLAFATLFKLFPIAIAMVFGIKNWRIFISCIVCFAVSFLIPGSFKWFQAISNIYPAHNPIYLWLKPLGLGYFVFYVVVIAGLTALFAYRMKIVNYPMLASLAIPAVFLTMPIVEFNHLAILPFSYAYLIAFFKTSNRLLLICLLLSFLLISAPFFIVTSMSVKVFAFLGLMVLWVGLTGYLFAAPAMQKKMA